MRKFIFPIIFFASAMNMNAFGQASDATKRHFESVMKPNAFGQASDATKRLLKAIDNSRDEFRYYPNHFDDLSFEQYSHYMDPNDNDAFRTAINDKEVQLNLCKTDACPLFYAIENAPATYVGALLARGANPNMTLNGESALSIAARGNVKDRERKMLYLLEYGANKDTLENYPLTKAMSVAASRQGVYISDFPLTHRSRDIAGCSSRACTIYYYDYDLQQTVVTKDERYEAKPDYYNADVASPKQILTGAVCLGILSAAAINVVLAYYDSIAPVLYECYELAVAMDI